MTGNNWPDRILILHEKSILGDFDLSFQKGFEANDCHVDFAHRPTNWATDYDLVLAYGPFTLAGGMIDVGKKLLKVSPEKRPMLVWWLTENPPAKWIPISVIKSTAMMRLYLDQIIQNKEESSIPRNIIDFLGKGHRIRIIGELMWMKKNNVLDFLISTSKWKAEYLTKAGFKPLIFPLGYHEVYGTDLKLPRDIDVVFIGDLSNNRRQKILPKIIDHLENKGLVVRIEENIYGKTRTKLLNQSKVMLNILRAPQDFVGQRFLLGAANKTLVVSEPVLDSSPFIPNEHIITTPIKNISDTIIKYINKDDQREKITNAAFDLATKKYCIENLIMQLLKTARGKYQEE